jgi:hypothetical protein
VWVSLLSVMSISFAVLYSIKKGLFNQRVK